jgi:hypothetical protein
MLIALLGGAVVLTPWVEFALQQAALITWSQMSKGTWCTSHVWYLKNVFIMFLLIIQC